MAVVYRHVILQEGQIQEIKGNISCDSSVKYITHFVKTISVINHFI